MALALHLIALIAALVAPAGAYVNSAGPSTRTIVVPSSASPAEAPSQQLLRTSGRCHTPPPREHVLGLQRATSYLVEDRAVSDALRFASAAHSGQRRASGEPFIVHPIETARILAAHRMDRDTIIAGLLHDTVEDTDVTVEDIRERFGDSVAAIVAGVTDGVEQPHDLNRQRRLEAMRNDWRVVLVKLADRLHNMRTLQHMPRVKQRVKARETVALYVPLAARMGVAEMEHELLQQSAHYLFPHCAAHLPPLAHVLGRLGASRELLTRDMEVALSGHRQKWATHKEWADLY